MNQATIIQESSWAVYQAGQKIAVAECDIDAFAIAEALGARWPGVEFKVESIRPAFGLAPVTYMVAEQRGGRWMFGDDWSPEFGALAEARETADMWRGRGRVEDVAVFAVVAVSDETDGSKR